MPVKKYTLEVEYASGRKETLRFSGREEFENTKKTLLKMETVKSVTTPRR